MKKAFELYRKQNNLTKRDFVKQLGVSQNTYNNWILGLKQPRSRFRGILDKFYVEKIALNEPKKEEVVQPVLHKRKMVQCQIFTALELIEQLQNGRIVYQTDTPYSVKMVDGFVFRCKGEDVISINSPILTSEAYHYFKPAPITLKVGKSYKTANGSTVMIYNKKPDTESFMGMVLNSDLTVEYDVEGKPFFSYEEELEIIEEK